MSTHPLDTDRITACVGRRFTVVKPSAWFPRDFTLDGENQFGLLVVRNEAETYFVSPAKFEQALGTVFVEAAWVGVETT